MRLILASSSPRRQQLLRLLDVPFEICTPAFAEEPRADLSPLDQACLFAREKARSCATDFPESVIVGSDTLVVLDGRALGKPTSLEEAAQMLGRLHGRDHDIYTAVSALRTPDGKEENGYEIVRVSMRTLSTEEIRAYVENREGMGKAGGYAIQGYGGTFMTRIAGDFTAAVGLPVRLVARLLTRVGIHSPVNVDALYRRMPFRNWDRFPPVSFEM